MLVVLDDCADEEQVRWFLPATAGCTLLVTSRNRLTGLAGAFQVEVDVLSLDHSLELLGNMLGAERLNAELNAATELVRLCGGLPLALRVAGARLAARPHWTIAHLVERLSDERRRLGELVYGGLDVRANLALSCRSLTPGAQTLFRRLGHLSASDFGGWICGPLMNTDTLTAIDLLDELVDARLVEVERGRGSSARFKVHDLIRAYSRELLDLQEDAAEREQTIQRLVGSWLFLAERAHRAEYGGDHTLIHGDAPRWPLPEATVEAALADSLAWYDSERGGLVAAVRLAAESGLDEACWDLATAAVTLFENRRYFQDWRVTHDLALAATRASGNRRGTAAMLCSLGSLTAFEQRYDQAWPLLEEAAQLFRELGHDHGYALSIRHQAYLYRLQGDLDSALAVFEEALALLQAAGDLVGEAHVLSNIAQIRLERGDADTAANDLKLALAAAEETGARRIHAQVLCRLGDLQLAADELTEAQRSFQRALDLVLVLHDRVGEAWAKLGLASVMLRLGRSEQADAMLRSACALAVHLGEAFVEARINLTIGQLHRGAGRLDQAASALSRALELFERLRANAWRERTLTLMNEIDSAAEPGDRRQI
jgi:tetratricopeptide (TPR) repeat protein